MPRQGHLPRQLRQRIDLRLRRDKSVPAYRLIDQFERIAAMFDRLSQRSDRRAEQPHKFADRADAVLIAPFTAAPCPGEKAPDKPVEHLDRAIGEPRIKVDDRRDQRRASPVEAIVGEQERRRRATFAHELREQEIGDFRAGRRGDADPAHIAQPFQQSVDVRRGGCFLKIAEPAQRRHAEVVVVDDQIVDPCEFGMAQAFDDERRRGFAGACPAGEARTLERVCRRKNEAFLLQPLHQRANNGLAPIGPLRSSCGEIERERYIPSPKRV